MLIINKCPREHFLSTRRRILFSNRYPKTEKPSAPFIHQHFQSNSQLRQPFRPETPIEELNLLLFNCRVAG